MGSVKKKKPHISNCLESRFYLCSKNTGRQEKHSSPLDMGARTERRGEGRLPWRQGSRLARRCADSAAVRGREKLTPRHTGPVANSGWHSELSKAELLLESKLRNLIWSRRHCRDLRLLQACSPACSRGAVHSQVELFISYFSHPWKERLIECRSASNEISTLVTREERAAQTTFHCICYRGRTCSKAKWNTVSLNNTRSSAMFAVHGIPTASTALRINKIEFSATAYYSLE